MNRPARNAFFGCLLVLAAATLWSRQAKAQSSLDLLKGEYDHCVFGSIAEQRPTRASIAGAAERAFQACLTEERAIASTLAMMPGSDMMEIVAAITAHKLQIKRVARDIVKN